MSNWLAPGHQLLHHDVMTIFIHGAVVLVKQHIFVFCNFPKVHLFLESAFWLAPEHHLRNHDVIVMFISGALVRKTTHFRISEFSQHKFGVAENRYWGVRASRYFENVQPTCLRTHRSLSKPCGQQVGAVFLLINAYYEKNVLLSRPSKNLS